MGTRQREDYFRMKTLHLVLTHHWFKETWEGRKRVEYRAMTTIAKTGKFKGKRVASLWMTRIWFQRETITHVRFMRGYTSTTATFRVEKIDIGPCPIEGWTGNYIRIHFTDL